MKFLIEHGIVYHFEILVIDVYRWFILFVFQLIDSIKHLFNGGAAGLLAKFAVYPFDLAKKRLEVVSFEEARSKFGQVFSYRINHQLNIFI